MRDTSSWTWARAASLRVPLLGAALCVAAPPAGGAIDRDTLDRLKRATVFVSLGQHRGAGSGSGFLVHRDGSRGLVVTNAHVVKGAPAGALRVVFDSGTRGADALPATVVGASEARDLAVLAVESPSLPEPLEISADATVYETQAVHIVGFPFGKGFATNRETPVVTISRGTVSSRRLDVNDQARLVQIDGDLNPGNSGGPIVDEAGRVVGVAVATVKQTNIGFAIPLAPLVEMLAGTLTDLHAEPVKDGVAVRGRLLDPLGGFRGATLQVREMSEDAVAGLIGADGRWGAIAPQAGTPFAERSPGTFEAVHPLPAQPAAGRSLVGQIRVAGAAGERHLPPFRIERRALAMALAGPDVRSTPAQEKGDGAPAPEAAPGAPAELEALFASSGLNGLMAAMSKPADSGIFREQESDEDERTVRERLSEIIEARWDEERIRRIYVRSFEADPNAEALRRVLRVFELPAMQLLHLTPDRFAAVKREELKDMEQAARRDPSAFDARMEIMREIDRRRGFTDLLAETLSTSVSTLSRLLNDLKPTGTRMSAELLERDVKQALATLQRQLRAAVPLILAHEYRDARDEDLHDYLAQLDGSAMRWFAERERAAYQGVVTTQFAEAEDEILALFKEVRREALGLTEAPDLSGLEGAKAMQALLDAYGKGALIKFVLKRRGGEITVTKRGGSFESRYGRPPEDGITSHSLLRDAQAMGVDVAEFATALEQFQVDQAYRDRRLAANAERSRLIDALRARREAAIRQAGALRPGNSAASQARAENACRRQCALEGNACMGQARQRMGYCNSMLSTRPSADRTRSQQACRDAARADAGACTANVQRCQGAC